MNSWKTGLFNWLKKRRAAIADDPPNVRACVTEAFNTEALKAFSPDTKSIIHQLNAQLSKLVAEAKYTEALPLGLRAYELAQQLGTRNVIFAGAAHNLGCLLRKRGRYSEAASYLNQALDSFRIGPGDQSPEFANSLNSLAGVYEDVGQFGDAQRLFIQSYKIRVLALGYEHPLVAQSMDNLANVMLKLGKPERAEALYRGASGVWRTTEGSESANLAINLSCLGNACCENGSYPEAELSINEAIKIFTKKYGEVHPDVAIALGNLANLYRRQHKYTELENVANRLLPIVARCHGEKSLQFARALQTLGELYGDLGNWKDAEPALREAIELASKFLGKNHRDIGDMLTSLAVVLVNLGNIAEAMSCCARANGIGDYLIRQIFFTVAESTRMTFVRTLQVDHWLFISLIINYCANDADSIGMAVDMVLQRKAIVAETWAVHRDVILSHRDPILASRLEQLLSLRKQIARLTLDGPAGGERDAHLRRLRSLVVDREILEAELAQEIPTARSADKFRKADQLAVSRAIPDGCALIEIIKLDGFDFKAVPAKNERRWQPPHYIAFVLHPEASIKVEVVDLGESAPIDRMVRALRTFITGEVNKEISHQSWEELRDSGGHLREVLFDPLKPHLRSKTQLLISPDGELNRLPFEILPIENGGYLIDEYRVSYLSAGRDVLRFGGAAEGGKPALVIADPDFGLSIAAAPATEKPPDNDDIVLPADIERIVAPHAEAERRSCRALGPFARLPGAQTEGRWVAGVLGASLWIGESALKARICSYNSPSVLHLATHGYFLSEDQDVNHILRWSDSTEKYDLDRISDNFSGNPLLRSGLALAGANTWIRNGNLPVDAGDGLLTGEDVSGLNLLGTHLVVLSACDTGLGQIHLGEGVLGLRRAFMLAGAGTLVMSLWKVPDEQTTDLMREFYTRLIDGESRSEALRQAQLTARSKYPDPGYWGAFICQGEISPIPNAGGLCATESPK